jgi:hypothetical protein
MRLVLPGVGRSAGVRVRKARFEFLRVTARPGFCTNASDPAIEGEDENGIGKAQDYSFHADRNKADIEVTLDTQAPEEFFAREGGYVDRDKTWVYLWCKDYGGKCVIRISLEGLNGGKIIRLGDLGIPQDDDDDGIADLWELGAISDWQSQYGHQPWTLKSLAPHLDPELRDPDGPGPLTDHFSEGDAIPVWAEYRGFMLDGGGFNPYTERPHEGGYIRLSPARKEALLEIDKEQYLAGVDGSDVRPFLDSAARILRREAGIYLYFLYDDLELPAHDFLPTDDVVTRIRKRQNYMGNHRGPAARNRADPMWKSFLRFLAHDMVISNLPIGYLAANELAATWYIALGEEQKATTGTLLATQRISEWAAGKGVPTVSCFGSLVAHELCHMLIHPRIGRDSPWDTTSHLKENPAGDELMALLETKNTTELGVRIRTLTQKEIDFMRHAGIYRHAELGWEW